MLGKAYSGLTDDEIEELTEHSENTPSARNGASTMWNRTCVLEIAFDAIRRSPRHDPGLALRFPRIKAIRRDKSIADIDTLQSARALL